MYQPEVVVDLGCTVGENPLWHPEEKSLYWVDIPEGKLFRYDTSSNSSSVVHQDRRMIGGFTLQSDGSLLLFMEKGAVKVWNDGEITTLIKEIPAERNSRFNDVIADSQGRVLAGTMPSEKDPGCLYKLNRDCTIETLLQGLDVPNGLGFTSTPTNLYLTESNAKMIHLFDYKQEDGTLCKQRTFIDTSHVKGVPDGMTIDSEGCIWSARWDGSKLMRYSPGGEKEMEISFPVKKVSSVTFGGEDYQDLYITTAGGNNKQEEGAKAGALFKIETSIQGKPEQRSQVRVE